MAEREVRQGRLHSLKKLGIDPYPAVTERTHSVRDVLGAFEELTTSQNQVVIAGRAKAIRNIGALTFVRVEDGTGLMQVVIRRDDLGDAYKVFSDHGDVGDFFEFKGTAFVTKTGEHSVLVSAWRFLAKALQPLPEKWHGLQDVETRYRHRELDLISNPDIRQRFVVRSKLVSAFRRLLDEQEFLEVETPMLQVIPGGANARPFVTHHNALGTDLYLRIAPELYLKRLIIGGFERVYEIGRCFRNEGIDFSHNPEFTMLELYWAYTSKEAFVQFMEQLLTQAIQASVGALTVTVNEQELDLTGPWPRLTFREAIQQETDIDIAQLSTPEQVEAAAKDKGLKIDFRKCVGLGECLDELWKKSARPKIVQPTWIFDYPVELKPLAKQSPDDVRASASTQLVIQGAEIVNAYYHELNDPLEQRRRFLEQQGLREQGSEEAQWLDEDFLDAMEHGMPPTSGFGIGIDRLAALITGSHNLKEIILFPTLKPEAKDSREGEV